MEDIQEDLTILQAAIRASCSPDTVRRAITSGALMSDKPGGAWANAWRIRSEDLGEWMEGRNRGEGGRGVWLPTSPWPVAVGPVSGGQKEPWRTPRGLVLRLTRQAVVGVGFTGTCEIGKWVVLENPYTPLDGILLKIDKDEGKGWFGGDQYVWSSLPPHDEAPRLPISDVREIVVLVPPGVALPKPGEEIAVDLFGRDFRFAAIPAPHVDGRVFYGFVQKGVCVDPKIGAAKRVSFAIGCLLGA